MDFVATAAFLTAVVGIGVAVEKFASERSAIRKVERLSAVLQTLPEGHEAREVLSASVLHQVQNIDFRVRGPRSWFKIIVGWLLQTLGILVLLVAYLGALAVLQPLLPKTEPQKEDDLLAQGIAIMAIALVAGLLWFFGRGLILGSRKARTKWFAETWPAAKRDEKGSDGADDSGTATVLGADQPAI